MNVDRLMFGAVWLLTICRWLLGSSMELTGAEALYWMESKHLAPFFLDHGPLAAALIGSGGWLFDDPVVAVRWLNPLLILLATWGLYLLARSVYHQVTARWSVVVFQLCPIVNIAGVMMLDLALTLCLGIVGFWFIWCALRRVNRWHAFWWAGGLAFGGAITLSLALGSLLAGLGLALCLSTKWRGQWLRPGIWVSVSVAFFLPLTLLWASGQAELALQRGLRGWDFQPHLLVRVLTSWVVWSGPLFIAGLVWLATRWRALRTDSNGRFLGSAGAVLLVLGIVGSAFSDSSGSVLILGTVLCLLVLVGQWMQADVDLVRKGKWRRWTLMTTGCLAVVGVNTENLRMIGLYWPSIADTPRLERGWVETAEAVEGILSAGQARQPVGLMLIAEDAETAALLDFYLDEAAAIFRPAESYPRVHRVESAGRDSVYSLWPNYSHALPGTAESTPFKGLDGLFMSRRGMESLPANLVHAFRTVTPAAVLEIKRNGRTLHRWHLFHAYDYQGLPL